VATRDVFSADELAHLRGFPEIGHAELIRFFMLMSGNDVSAAPNSASRPARQGSGRRGRRRRTGTRGMASNSSR